MMNLDQLKMKWAEDRKQGRWRYAIKAGVLYWGGFMVITLTLWSIVNQAPSQGFVLNLKDLIQHMTWFLPGGFVFGLLLWSLNERFLTDKDR